MSLNRPKLPSGTIVRRIPQQLQRSLFNSKITRIRMSTSVADKKQTMDEKKSVGEKSTNGLSVSVLTGGFDKPYAYGLVTSLGAEGIRAEVIGSDEVDC